MSSTSSRRNFLQAIGAMTTFSGAAPAAVQTAKRRPNVIVLLSDDQGYADLSCHGNPALKTPAFDKLHGESVRFTDFHAAPMCTPTRGQLLSGQDALHNGATSVTAGRALLRRGLPTMADVFAASGYSTGLFGKWHVGDNYPYRPKDRGFQESKYFFGFGMSSAPEFDNDYFNGRYQHNAVPKRFSGYCTDFWFDSAIAWMTERSGKQAPFLCYLPTNIPHGPTWVDEKYCTPYRKPKMPAEFFGMIANLDENVAKLDAFLNRSGLRENTILIYMSDNGGTGGVTFFNAGMRGRKTQLWEGGHRVPCFVSWPAGKLRTPCDIGVPAQMQDVLPTLIDLCGIAKPRNASFDGTSLAPLLKGTAAKLPDRMLVVQYGQIIKKWDSCVIWNSWRLVNGTELYDLKTDFAQASDIAAKHPDVVKKMRAHYEGWWARVEPGLREYAPISIGSEQENPVKLCSSDWEDVYCDNPRSILGGEGGPQGGPWSVFIERDGDYEIELRRWPVETDLPLNAATPVKKLTRGSLPAGKAMPIARARLTIAGQDLSAKSAAADKSMSFRVKLKGGVKTRLHAWFQDAEGKDVCGAFYASVRRR